MPTPEDLINRFAYHPVTSEQESKMDSVRSQLLTAALFINATCPESRELSLAITNLEQAMRWANAAISIPPLKKE